MQYWLMKSEPDTYGIDDLERAGKPSMWEGCRNYVVRNYLRDEMQEGDMAFFHHSNSKPSGIIGTMKIVGQPYPDPTQFDPNSHYYDPKSPRDKPRWVVRDVVFERKFKRIISLDEIRTIPGLEQMGVIRKGNRLSIQKVTPEEWKIILSQPGI
ncbi:MAG: EVE domain-containing protein [Armatimonadetes bacterium]|nr:EVE domain-containing protein [Armatimonadota bacterium]